MRVVQPTVTQVAFPSMVGGPHHCPAWPNTAIKGRLWGGDIPVGNMGLCNSLIFQKRQFGQGRCMLPTFVHSQLQSLVNLAKQKDQN